MFRGWHARDLSGAGRGALAGASAPWMARL